MRGGGYSPAGSRRCVDASPSFIEHAQERCPMVEPVKRQVAGEIELTEMKVGCTGIGTDLKWVMCRAQETRDLAGKLHDVVHHMRQGDECGEAFLSRKVALRVAPWHGGSLRSLLRSSRSPLSGLRPQRAVNAAALWLVIGWCILRTTARRSITFAVWGKCSQTRVARHAGCDRAELPTDLRRGVGLHVEGIDVAGTTVMEDEDARADRPSRPARALRASRLNRIGLGPE